MKFEHFKELKTADKFLARYVINKCANNILISGGTSFIPTLKIISLKNTQLNFYLTDERDVKNCSSDSNLYSYNKLKYTNMSFSGFIPEKDSKKTINNYEAKLPKNYFDLCLLGVGEDGHIASIFPNECDFIYDSNYSFYCKSDYHQHNRFSLNLNYIKKSKTIVLYFRGSNKIEAYNKFFNESFYPLNQLIAQKEKLIIIIADGKCDTKV
jgi:6-phosphogluconolactonase